MDDGEILKVAVFKLRATAAQLLRLATQTQDALTARALGRAADALRDEEGRLRSLCGPLQDGESEEVE